MSERAFDLFNDPRNGVFESFSDFDAVDFEAARKTGDRVRSAQFHLFYRFVGSGVSDLNFQAFRHLSADD